MKFWHRKTKRKFPAQRRVADLMIRELVKAYDASDRNLTGQLVKQDGLDIVNLGSKVGLLPEMESVLKEGKIVAQEKPSDWLESQKAGIREMEERGWVRSIFSGTNTAVMPTPQGLDYGRRFLRMEHWYWRFWDWLKGDVRTLIIGSLSGAGAAVLATLIMKLLGWIN